VKLSSHLYDIYYVFRNLFAMFTRSKKHRILYYLVLDDHIVLLCNL